MSPRIRKNAFFSWGVVLGGILLAGVLVGSLILVIYLIKPEAPAAAVQTPVITVLPAPSLTPPIPLPTISEQQAATTPASTVQPTSSGPISIGTYVEIGGTQGVGLHIRSSPGVSSQPLFLGIESEVYLVSKGPEEKDGYTWWYLVAPYDKNRAGWAAANYLIVIKQP